MARQIFVQFPITKFHKIHSAVRELLHGRRWTERSVGIRTR